jgi:hypothetical protein
MLFLKQIFINPSDSCILKPSLTSIRGLRFARDLVRGLNTSRIQDRLISVSVYSFLEDAKYHPGIGWVVQVLRCVEA